MTVIRSTERDGFKLWQGRQGLSPVGPVLMSDVNDVILEILEVILKNYAIQICLFLLQ